MAKSRSLSLVEASASKCGEISTIKCVLLGLLGADRSFSLSTMRRASVSIRLSCKAVTWALAVRSQTEYSQYRTAIEKWKKETGKEPVAHGIRAKLAEKKQEIQNEQKNKQHIRSQNKDRGAR